MDRKAFSDLISLVYDCAVDSELWPEALGQICRTLRFRKGTIDLNRLPSMTNLFNAHYGIDRQQAATMVSNYHAMPEVWGGIAATMSRPIDRPWVVSRIVPQEALRKMPYYKNWVGPMGLVDGAAIVLARDSTLFGSMRLATDCTRGMIDDDLIGSLQMLLPHCQRAARISGLLDVTREAAKNFQAVIDALSLPIVLVSASCAIVHANAGAVAMFEEGGPLFVHNGRLHAASVSLLHAITSTVGRMADDESTIQSAGIGLPISVPPHQPRTLHFLPLGKGDLRSRMRGDAVAALFVTNITVNQNIVSSVPAKIYGLTSAEIGVFQMVAAGRTTKEIATELCVADSTVRTHILHLFQKTNTHSRAELMCLARAYARPTRVESQSIS